LPGFLDSCLRLPTGCGLLPLASDVLVSRVLRGGVKIDALATLGVRVDVVLLALIRSPDAPPVGQRLHVRDLLWSVRRPPSEPRLAERILRLRTCVRRRAGRHTKSEQQREQMEPYAKRYASCCNRYLLGRDLDVPAAHDRFSPTAP